MTETTEANKGPEPQHVEYSYGISTHLENYRFVEGVAWDASYVLIEIEVGTAPYDEDAVIGTVVNNFDLILVGEAADGRLAFKRQETEEEI